jgi:hypothetical protein
MAVEMHFVDGNRDQHIYNSFNFQILLEYGHVPFILTLVRVLRTVPILGSSPRLSLEFQGGVSINIVLGSLLQTIVPAPIFFAYLKNHDWETYSHERSQFLELLPQE